jgi:hypothetical protein
MTNSLSSYGDKVPEQLHWATGVCCSSAILTAPNSSAILSGYEGQDRFELS